MTQLNPEAPGGDAALPATLAPLAPLMPAGEAPSGLTTGANFLQGPGGREKRGFANFAPLTVNGFGAGWAGGAIGSTWGNLAHRDRVISSTIGNELAVSAASLKTIVDVLTQGVVGPDGLTLSAKVDAERIGLTDAQARDINKKLERLWADWTSNPEACDLTARFDFHSLATQAFHRYLLDGEALAFVDVARFPGVSTLTKVALSDARIIDMQSKTVPGGYVFQGMQFSQRSRWEGIWARRIPLGATVLPGELKFIPARTGWGRPKTLHLFTPIVAQQVRGLSPLTNSLAAIASKELLSELTVAGHAAQLNYALTIESDAPSEVALGGLEIPHEPGALEGAIAGGIAEMREIWYGQKGEGGGPGVHPRLSTEGGTAVHLLPGDELKLTQPAKLADNYEALNRALLLEASRAAGVAASSITGDYGAVNFSAAKIENQVAHIAALQRRREIVAKFYATYYRAFVEEIFALGLIELPAGVKTFFWDCPTAFTRASFMGAGAIDADKLKSAQASVLRLANGLDSMSEILSQEGKDFDTHLDLLKREREAFKAAGLPVDYVTVSQRRIEEDEDAGGDAQAPEDEQNKGNIN